MTTPSPLALATEAMRLSTDRLLALKDRLDTINAELAADNQRGRELLASFTAVLDRADRERPR